MNNKRQKGQMLAEVVIAIGLLALILVGMSELITRSTVSIRLNKEKDEASRAVEARLSYLRQERDRDPIAFFATQVHDLDSGNFADCTGSTIWPVSAQYTFACTERYSSTTAGVLVEVMASWTYKTTNDLNVTLATIISQP
jgi:hypothetical protein